MAKKLCVFCDGVWGMTFFETDAGLDLIVGTITGMKLCNPHADELQKLADTFEKREIERTVA